MPMNTKSCIETLSTSREVIATKKEQSIHSFPTERGEIQGIDLFDDSNVVEIKVTDVSNDETDAIEVELSTLKKVVSELEQL